jgi:AcrR family transcriptional regulator
MTMGAEGRKEKEKIIRRNDIIEAAERVIFTKGYNQATMDDVAKEAEFSKRTIYVYFNSKEQIYFEIMIKGYRLLLNRLIEDLQQKESKYALDKIRQIADTLYRFYLDYPKYFSAIMEYENTDIDFQDTIPDKSREECYAIGEEILKFLTDALREGIHDGSVKKDLDVIKTALVLWSYMLGVFGTIKKKEKYILNFHKITSEELVSEAFKLIQLTIMAEKEAEGKR